MIALTEFQHDLLCRISDAGTDGYEVQQGELCAALHMGTYGIVEFTNARQSPQRVRITARGRQFIWRTAA